MFKISRETFKAYCRSHGLKYNEARYINYLIFLKNVIARGKDPNRKTLRNREA